MRLLRTEEIGAEVHLQGAGELHGRGEGDVHVAFEKLRDVRARDFHATSELGLIQTQFLHLAYAPPQERTD